MPLEIPDKRRFHPQELYKYVLHPLKILRLKTKILIEVPHDFFLITPKNFTLFLINPWKMHLIFLQDPWKFHILNPHPPFFFWNSPISYLKKYQVLHIMHETHASALFLMFHMHNKNYLKHHINRCVAFRVT